MKPWHEARGEFQDQPSTSVFPFWRTQSCANNSVFMNNNPYATQNQSVPTQHLPACLRAEDAARFLGWPTYFLTILVRAGHIKPLGKPAQNSVKWYATVELERLGRDPEWLDRAIRIVEKRTKTANDVAAKNQVCQLRSRRV
jgi:hypothetical protein